MNFFKHLKTSLEVGKISEKIYHICLQLYTSYSNSITKSGLSRESCDPVFYDLLALVEKHVREPFLFSPFHKKVFSPFNYHEFGLRFLRPLMDKAQSSLKGMQNLEKIREELNRQENAIFFANHQTEIDPQLIELALEEKYPTLGSNMIFVAGDRVLTDSVAVPFSIGCNLLCIHSKRHIHNPPEKKQEKLQHNQRTMQVMKQLLSEGGKCIYVAPSGGRDRLDDRGEVAVAPFDPPSIEMFWLMAKQAKRPVHFYPLSLFTFDILPPPKAIESEVGEIRCASRRGAHFYFGDEIDMEKAGEVAESVTDRHLRREARASYIWSLVKKNYILLKDVSCTSGNYSGGKV